MDINQIAVGYDQEEEFEAGREAMAKLLPEKVKFTAEFSFEKALAYFENDQQKLAGFWAAYFSARLKIEQSYDFISANNLFDWGLKLLESIEDQSVRPDSCLELRTTLEIMAVHEDRGIHNNHFLTSQKATEYALDLINQQPACQAELEKKKVYLEAIQLLSSTLAERENGGAISNAKWQNLKTALRAAYDSTKESKVYSSMLKAHLASIDYLQKAPSNKLMVEEGCLVSTYYATINTIQVESLIDALENEEVRNKLIKALNVQAFYEPEPPDILSDMSENDHFHVWQFDFEDVQIAEFRDQSLNYDLGLRFNSLGLLQLQFKTDLAGMDVNSIRHLTNLPLENALDENICWNQQSYPYLRDLAKDVFAQVERWFGTESSLIYNTSEDVSSNLLIETIIDQAEPETFMDFESLQQHPDWLGIMTPPREVRSAFENWRAQKPHAEVHNIATDLYHADDWIQADGSYSVIVQLDQPSWVTEQAIENMLVATGARFYMKQLGKMLFTNVRNIQFEYHDDEDIEGKTRYELREQERKYRARVKQLHRLNLEVRDLLHLMDTGGLMRFPDHGRFIQKLFTAVGVNKERKELESIMKESKEATRYLRVQITNALEQLSEKSSQRFDAVIGFMGVLLSVGAFSDMFDIIEETGTDIPALVEAEIIFGVMIVIVLYFSIEAIIRRFK